MNFDILAKWHRVSVKLLFCLRMTSDEKNNYMKMYLQKKVTFNLTSYSRLTIFQIHRNQKEIVLL
jgi:hypothetical protein